MMRTRPGIAGAAAIALPLIVFGLFLLVLFVLKDDEQPSLRLTESDMDDVWLPKHDNHRPILGILTQPSEDGHEYIAASYVKYAEAAGARVVPIRFGWTDKQLKAVFKGLNGVLLPGGGASIDPTNSKIYRAASVLFAEAEKSNKIGQRFPIWGTCLGWELLATLASDYSILKESGVFLDPSTSNGIQRVDLSSKLFRNMNRKLARAIAGGQKLFYFSHEMGVTPEMFQKNLDQKCWKSVALGQDKVGKYFVAAAESRCRPYFGVQFHPEKALYEWFTKVSIPHSFPATETSRHFISILGQELRWSRPGNMKESEVFARDIHQYPIKTNGDAYFFQEYVFPNDDKNKTVLFDEENELNNEASVETAMA